MARHRARGVKPWDQADEMVDDDDNEVVEAGAPYRGRNGDDEDDKDEQSQGQAMLDLLNAFAAVHQGEGESYADKYLDNQKSQMAALSRER